MDQPLTDPTTPSLASARDRCVLTWWMLLPIALLAFGVFANSLANGFAYDDLGIVQSPNVTNREWTAIWSDNYWPAKEGLQPDALYRPLTLWTYLVNESISPGVAWPFHLVNVLLHVLVSVLAAVLTFRLMGDRRIAFVTGVLFAVHPLHTEAIANTVGRAELLASLWSLLALLVYLPARPLSEETSPQKRPWWHGLLVAICFMAAILCKETPVMLLLTIPLVDLWRWTRWQRALRPSFWRWMARQGLRYYTPMTAFLAVYLWLRVRACGLMTDIHGTHHIVNGLVDATPLQRIVTPFTLLAKYMLLTLWPNHLSADYSLPSLLPTSDLFYSTSMQPPAILGLMLCVLVGAGVILLWRKAPQFALLVGLFGTGYALVANFLRIGTIFGERLFYWPSLFVLILIAWGMVRLQEHALQQLTHARARRLLQTAAVSILTTVVLLMGWRSAVRNTDWKDNITLAISTARDNPDSGKTCAWAGSVLTMTGRPECVEFGKALLERGLALTPDYVVGRWELAKFYGIRHNMGQSAICVAQASRYDAGTHMTRLAIPALVEELRTNDPSSYMPDLEAYQRANPDDACAYMALALGYHAQRRYDLAEINARKAIDMAKHVRADGADQFHEAAAELASIWFDAGKPKEAVDKFRLYAAYMCNSVEAHCTFAALLMAVDPGQFPDARKEAQLNLNIANNIDRGNVGIRMLQGKLNRLNNELAKSAAPTESRIIADPSIGSGR